MLDAAEGEEEAAAPPLLSDADADAAPDFPSGLESLSILKRPSSLMICTLFLRVIAFLYLLDSALDWLTFDVSGGQRNEKGQKTKNNTNEVGGGGRGAEREGFHRGSFSRCRFL